MIIRGKEMGVNIILKGYISGYRCRIFKTHSIFGDIGFSMHRILTQLNLNE